MKPNKDDKIEYKELEEHEITKREKISCLIICGMTIVFLSILNVIILKGSYYSLIEVFILIFNIGGICFFGMLSILMIFFVKTKKS